MVPFHQWSHSPGKQSGPISPLAASLVATTGRRCIVASWAIELKIVEVFKSHFTFLCRESGMEEWRVFHQHLPLLEDIKAGPISLSWLNRAHPTTGRRCIVASLVIKFKIALVSKSHFVFVCRESGMAEWRVLHQHLHFLDEDSKAGSLSLPWFNQAVAPIQDGLGFQLPFCLSLS